LLKYYYEFFFQGWDISLATNHLFQCCAGSTDHNLDPGILIEFFLLFQHSNANSKNSV